MPIDIAKPVPEEFSSFIEETNTLAYDDYPKKDHFCMLYLSVEHDNKDFFQYIVDQYPNLFERYDYSRFSVLMDSLIKTPDLYYLEVLNDKKFFNNEEVIYFFKSLGYYSYRKDNMAFLMEHVPDIRIYLMKSFSLMDSEVFYYFLEKYPEMIDFDFYQKFLASFHKEAHIKIIDQIFYDKVAQIFQLLISKFYQHQLLDIIEYVLENYNSQLNLVINLDMIIEKLDNPETKKLLELLTKYRFRFEFGERSERFQLLRDTVSLISDNLDG